MFAARFSGFCIVLVTLLGSASAWGQSLQLVSTIDPLAGPPAGGSGDSWAPLISPDGRYVLFASEANNLWLTTNQTAMPGGFPPSLNVFLRDRVKGKTSPVSVDLTGLAGGNGDSLPLGISTNGRFALFESRASNLLLAPADDNGTSDIFLRDLVNSTTILVSANTNGDFGNGPSRNAVMTPDGRYVAFVSEASDLVPGDTNQIADVFVRDIQAGMTALVSVGALSTNASLRYGSSEAPDISADGRYIAFSSTATNLVQGVTSANEIYARDTVANKTIWASIGASQAGLAVFGPTNLVSFNHAISADGGYLVYETAPPSTASGLLLRFNLGNGLTDTIYTNSAVSVAAGYQYINSLDLTPDGKSIAFIANAGVSSNPPATTCVLVWNADKGTLTLASGDLNGKVPTNSTCDWPAIDVAGRYVAFLSTAPGLVTNSAPGDYHLYRRDLQAGATTLIDADTNGVGSIISPATAPSLSADGRFVAFDCNDSNLVPDDRNRDSDVFVRDLSNSTTEMVSAHDPVLGSVSANGLCFLTSASISSDGRFVAFVSEASNLVPGDTNNCRDIFLRDAESGTIILVSIATNGLPANGASFDPAISADGRYVAFTSMADNLVPGDTNQDQDVFIRDMQAGTTTLVSVNSNGDGPGNHASYSPILSADGRYVLFQSLSTDLAPSTGSRGSVFFRDLQTRTTFALPGALTATMSGDARYVFFWGPLVGAARIWDRQVGPPPTFSINPPLLYPPDAAFSPDGRKLAVAGTFSSASGPTSGLFLVDVTNFSNQPTGIDSAPLSTSFSQPKWSADGNKLAYGKYTYPSHSKQAWVHDFQTGTNFLVSHTHTNLTDEGGGISDSADVSADGRFIAYRSTATNIVAGLASGQPAIYLYDFRTRGNTLLVRGALDTKAGNRPLRPFFSGDGRVLYFAGWSADLVSNDFNHNTDLFEYSFLYAVLVPPGNAGQGSTISWPYTPRKNYRVQYKDGFGDGTWHNLSGTINPSGNKAWIQDTNANATHRVYRIANF